MKEPVEANISIGSKGNLVKVGYVYPTGVGEYIRRADSILKSIIERLVAAFLLLLASPLFIVIPILIKLQDGGPVFFRSRRLGRHKRVFYMYKFRSLALDAEQKVGGQLLHHSHKLETPIGGFIRDTRLDELPQLINVALGHMQFIGPRPERPSVYEAQCAHLPGYNKRFNVKPGLFGYAQLYTPHSTPKRIRAMIDNRYMYKSENCIFTAVWVAWAVFFMCLRLLRKATSKIRMRILLVWRASHPVDRRTLNRVRPRGVKVKLTDESGTQSQDAEMVDVNDEHMLIYTESPLSDSALNITLELKTTDRLARRSRGKIARVSGSISRKQESEGRHFKHAYIVRYRAETPLNQYFVDKYLLKYSIA